MDNNVFTNKELYSHHYNKEDRTKRLGDFEKIYSILKSHLEPKSKAKINESKIVDYINLYKIENQEFIKRVLTSINHITWDKFCKDTWEQLDILNANIKDKKYVYVIGVNDQVGSSSSDYNIYKSNLWMFMLIYDKLVTKPYDIILNLKIGIQLYGDLHDFLIVDDCSYSGTQISQQVLYTDASESLYKYPNSYLIKNDTLTKTIFKPISNHNIKVHLFIPYIGLIAWDKISKLKLFTCLDIQLYNKYIINNFSTILSIEDSNKLWQLYKNIYDNYNPLFLLPIFFDHKIADTISTVELILIKGQVLDDSSKRLIFVEPCDKLYSNMENEYIYKILYCPIPPYQNFYKLLKEKL